MPNSIIRAMIDALLPPGAIWEAEPNESFDQQLEGISDSIEDIKITIDSLEHIRNPFKTPVFTDLERNFGFQPNENVDLEIRRKRLSRRIYKKDRNNAVGDLQDDLDFSGFNLQVHQNDPPVDPSLFFPSQPFQMAAGSDYAYAGYNLGAEILSYAGSYGAKFLVNTLIIKQEQAVTMQAGDTIAFAGYNVGEGVISVAGYFRDYIYKPIIYDIPLDPDYWPMIFFIGGNATRDPATNELVSISPGNVDINRQVELDQAILRAKSLGVWCILIVNYS